MSSKQKCTYRDNNGIRCTYDALEESNYCEEHKPLLGSSRNKSKFIRASIARSPEEEKEIEKKIEKIKKEINKDK